MFQRTAVRGRHVRDGGATAVEYALILGGVVLAAGLAVIGLRSVMSGALLGASNDQAILSDGSTATPPGGTGGPAPTGSTVAPSASTATPVPTTPTPTLTTATPAPTTPTAVPTTATPTPTTPTPTPTTPTPTLTSATPTPTPSQTALSRQRTFSETLNQPNNYQGFTCTITPPTYGSGRNTTPTGTCDYVLSRTNPDTLQFNPDNNVPIGTVITVTWVIQVVGPDITVTRTFVIGA